MYGLTDAALADDAGISPSKILGAAGPSAIFHKTYYVDSTHALAADTGFNGTVDKPFATVSYVLLSIIPTLSAAQQAGCTILVAPGHAETITNTANLWTMPAAGISIVGCGLGDRRPKITLSGSTAANISLNRAGLRLINLWFECAVNNLVKFIGVTGSGCEIGGCLFTEASGAALPIAGIIIMTGGARCYIHDFQMYFPTAGVSSNGISITAVVDGLRIERCQIHGAFSQTLYSCIYSAFALTNYVIQDCVLNNTAASSNNNRVINFTAATSGIWARNSCGALRIDDTGPTAVVIGSGFACKGAQSYCAGNDGAVGSGVLAPAATT